ncbi:MAG: hypothetical protein A2Y91_03500 [Chloroflexi bacterium RBG_13_54_8]|nr:MAG: hypothetical protein A2Y91_03500 [Chloroflexi bacterium RBG_13_54_8]
MTIAGDRVYPQVLPPKVTLPAISYNRISTPRVRSLSGSSHLAMPRFQFTAWAITYEEARFLMDEIKADLNDFSGTVGGMIIQASKVENELDRYEPTPGIYGIIADFIVAHTD